MLERIREFSYWIGVDPFWSYVLLILIMLLIVVKCIYPWRARVKSVTTKDKDGNTVTKYYHLDL